MNELQRPTASTRSNEFPISLKTDPTLESTTSAHLFNTQFEWRQLLPQDGSISDSRNNLLTCKLRFFSHFCSFFRIENNLNFKESNDQNIQPIHDPYNLLNDQSMKYQLE